MCQCTPHIRTPWCGKQGCQQPKQKDKVMTTETRAQLRERLEKLRAQYKGAHPQFDCDIISRASREHMDASERLIRDLEARLKIAEDALDFMVDNVNTPEMAEYWAKQALSRIRDDGWIGE